MATAIWAGQNYLTTLAEVKPDFMNTPYATDVGTDAQLLRYIAQASRMIENNIIDKFMPYTDTRTFDVGRDTWERQLFLDKQLLSITTMTVDNGSTTLATSDYRLLPTNDPPHYAVELKDDAANIFTYSTRRQDAISITGQWGWHNTTYASGATVDEELSDSDTTMTVSDGTLLSEGMHLLIESEQIFVRAIATNDVTVARGINGTTAAAHASTTAISVYRPPEDIIESCGILTARLSKRGDAAGTDLAGTPATGFSVTRSLPSDVKEMLRHYFDYGL